MVCSNCGIENIEDALFCAHCGVKLEKHEPQGNFRRCPDCGFENPSDGKYCARCGADFSRRDHREAMQYSRYDSRKQSKKNLRLVNTKPRWRLGVLALLLVVGVGVFIYLISPRSNNQQQAALPVIESRSGDPRVEAKVLEIASKFICSCGACGEKPLDTCACPKAAEERQFIRNSLQVGQTQEQVIAAVKATYGWMKPEFAAKDDSNAAVAAKLKPPVIAKQTDAVLTKLASKVGSNARLVTVADRVEVFSHFKCPCGQCGVEELKDCGCSHPRGATEVKAFVDQKIAEGKYALSQVIDLVDKQYGGRKF